MARTSLSLTRGECAGECEAYAVAKDLHEYNQQRVRPCHQHAREHEGRQEHPRRDPYRSWMLLSPQRRFTNSLADRGQIQRCDVEGLGDSLLRQTGRNS